MENNVNNNNDFRVGPGYGYSGKRGRVPDASMPSKYQTTVISNADKMGFMSQTKRFLISVNEVPAPCQYANHGKFDMSGPSFSSKGTGALASRAKRGFKYTYTTDGPSPWNYSLPTALNSRHDFNTKNVTNLFAAPVATNKPIRRNIIPGPNVYKVVEIKTGKVNNMKANCVFKSTSKREMMEIDKIAKLPAPAQYHIKDDLVCPSVTIPFSSFRSRSKREMIPKPEAFPGPGYYRPHEEVDAVKRMTFPRQHFLCLSNPPLPIRAQPEQPGPGSYEMVNYEGPPKHMMSSAVFKSTTQRTSGTAERSIAEMPGPTTYQTVNTGKQSFIYNLAQRWL